MSDEATRAQIDAARPDRSTWLSANAGSGKTRVLTDRVALLLLRGVQPQHILCLTYTKAAASEMQNRLFQRLGAWAMMPDPALEGSLLALGVSRGEVNSETLRKARVLFAQAIETPGGLKIQTIHSFCAALLRRFPLEAQVSPAFTEMDDRTSKLLRAEVLDQIAEDMPEVMRGFTNLFTGDDPHGLLAEIVKHRDMFETELSQDELQATVGLAAGVDETTILNSAFIGNEAEIAAAVTPTLQEGTVTDARLASALTELDMSQPSLSLLAPLEPIFLTGAGAKNPFSPKASPPTKASAEALGGWADRYRDWQGRVAKARDNRLALQAYTRAKALHAFAGPFIDRIEAAKQRRGWLDFDDLIRKARALLTDQSVAAWVLFRLDGGIDHILVDEAQDTSPAQWDVIRLLSEEFFSGESARAEQRTVFVVGDQKQSIYSFQGAQPAEFDRMRAYFEQRHHDIAAPFASRELLYSFRSAAPVLQLVDAVFTPELRRGMGPELRHKPFKTALPGRVELWDWTEGTEDAPEKPWFDPVDTVAENHPSVLLAGKIAAFIKDQITFGQITQDVRVDGEDKTITRPIRAGDFLILVQSRSGQANLFGEIIRACKTLGLPMAGADRLRVGGELGVRDLVALLSFLETPQDDLALAEVMRSPLGNLSEQDLFSLAHGREGLLWSAFDARANEFPQLHAMLTDLRDQADFMRPYDLLERALTRHHGRARLLARLGQEAEEGITALLDQSLQYELMEAPTLTGFLTWLATDDVTIKRQMDSDGDLIRVMTVHGAKGLEAPIVILPETGLRQNRLRDDILNADGVALWKSPAPEASAAQIDLTEAAKDLRKQENMRLLYVAMTRAESWLITCGSGMKPPTTGESWYEIIENGMTRAGAAPQKEVRLRLSHGDWPARTEARDGPEAKQGVTLPDWVERVSVPPPEPPQSLQPSNLGGAKILPTIIAELSEADAKRRGTQIHLLLEHLAGLPAAQRPARAEGILSPDDMDDFAEVLAHAEAVLDAPALAFLFEDSALAEVQVTACLPELSGRRIGGAIDRLIIEPDRVLAVDFKSNHDVPETAQEVPEGLLRQMGAYAAALAQIYPDKRIETAIVWTRTAMIMSLPHDIVRQALRRAHIS
jgi:ATP-dependent helicase/nuclease subunit A